MLERMRFRRRVSASVFADEEEGDFGEGLEEDDVAMALDISNCRRRTRQEKRMERNGRERKGFFWKIEIMLSLLKRRDHERVFTAKVVSLLQTKKTSLLWRLRRVIIIKRF